MHPYTTGTAQAGSLLGKLVRHLQERVGCASNKMHAIHQGLWPLDTEVRHQFASTVWIPLGHINNSIKCSKCLLLYCICHRKALYRWHFYTVGQYKQYNTAYFSKTFLSLTP